MKKIINILIASFFGLLIMIAGLTRFHHHLSNEDVCFCVDIFEEGDCCHHNHGDADSPLNPFGSHTENSCPLHIDFFNISEYSINVHYARIICCDYHCDICLPIVSPILSRDSNSCGLVFSTLFFDCAGYDSALSRRGPPSAIA